MHLHANDNNFQFWSLANEMDKCKYGADFFLL